MITPAILLNRKRALRARLRLQFLCHELLRLGVHLIEFVACLARVPGAAVEVARELTAGAAFYSLVETWTWAVGLQANGVFFSV